MPNPLPGAVASLCVGEGFAARFRLREFEAAARRPHQLNKKVKNEEVLRSLVTGRCKLAATALAARRPGSPPGKTMGDRGPSCTPNRHDHNDGGGTRPVRDHATKKGIDRKANPHRRRAVKIDVAAGDARTVPAAVTRPTSRLGPSSCTVQWRRTISIGAPDGSLGAACLDRRGKRPLGADRSLHETNLRLPSGREDILEACIGIREEKA